MAQKNRAQMLTDITTNIFNNVINFITGQNAQDRLVNLLDSSPNIISDKDQADGYVGLDANGNMFSSYYNENISRADLVTLLTTTTAVIYKLYQVNDAVGATKILLVIADSNITLYPFAIDLTTAEIGTYNINTDTFTVLAGSVNASIISTTVTGLQGLQTTSSLSTTTLYNVTDAVGNTLILQVYAIANNTNVVYAIDVASGTIGTYNITTDTFTATTSTPDLQQVTDVGFTTNNRLLSDDGAGNYTEVGNGYVLIATGNTGDVQINASQVTASYTAQLPDKATSPQTFAMLSDITGGGGDVYLANDQTFTGENTFAIGSGNDTPIIITKGGNGAALKVTKSSGSGDAIEVAQGSVSIDDETASTIASFDANKRIKSLNTATYPSLTELSYVKGVGSQVVGTTDTNTLTNKRITARTGTVASSATPTINTDNVDFYSITALATAITSMTTNLSGTPTDAQTLWIAITDNGTARAITWGASFEASTIALPTTTVISTRLDVAFIWNTATSKWRCVGVA
jgi:hypothetical protein